MIKKIKKNLFGNDIFISYSRRDCSNYAAAMANILTEQGYTCFIDQWGTKPGEDLPSGLKRTLHSSSMLILLGTQKAIESNSIAKEVSEYSKNHKGIIVPIDFGHLKKADWYGNIRGLAVTEEDESLLISAEPSDAVIKRITNSFKYNKQNQRLRKITYVTAAIFLILVIASIASLIFFSNHVAKSQSELTAAKDSLSIIQKLEEEMRERNKSLLDSASQLSSINDSLNTKVTESEEKLFESNEKLSAAVKATDGAEKNKRIAEKKGTISDLVWDSKEYLSAGNTVESFRKAKTAFDLSYIDKDIESDPKVKNEIIKSLMTGVPVCRISYFDEVNNVKIIDDKFIVASGYKNRDSCYELALFNFSGRKLGSVKGIENFTIDNELGYIIARTLDYEIKYFDTSLEDLNIRLKEDIVDNIPIPILFEGKSYSNENNFYFFNKNSYIYYFSDSLLLYNFTNSTNELISKCNSRILDISPNKSRDTIICLCEDSISIVVKSKEKWIRYSQFITGTSLGKIYNTGKNILFLPFSDYAMNYSLKENEKNLYLDEINSAYPVSINTKVDTLNLHDESYSTKFRKIILNGQNGIAAIDNLNGSCDIYNLISGKIIKKMVKNFLGFSDKGNFYFTSDINSNIEIYSFNTLSFDYLNFFDPNFSLDEFKESKKLQYYDKILYDQQNESFVIISNGNYFFFDNKLNLKTIHYSNDSKIINDLYRKFTKNYFLKAKYYPEIIYDFEIPSSIVFNNYSLLENNKFTRKYENSEIWNSEGDSICTINFIPYFQENGLIEDQFYWDSTESFFSFNNNKWLEITPANKKNFYPLDDLEFYTKKLMDSSTKIVGGTFSKDEKYFVAEVRGNLFLWNFVNNSRKNVNNLYGSLMDINSSFIDFSPKGDKLFCYNEEPQILKILDLNSLKIEFEISLLSNSLIFGRFGSMSPNGNYIHMITAFEFSDMSRHKIFVLNLEDTSKYYLSEDIELEINKAQFNSSSEWIIYSTFNKVVFWNFKSNQKFEYSFQNHIQDFCLTKNDLKLLVLTGETLESMLTPISDDKYFKEEIEKIKLPGDTKISSNLISNN